ncbi:ABC transporter permease [Couchioplanes caeruleus]|uniref:ABC transporter permease n=2 Tax=Couchioplanes caeruleus TaxID=56438 RepID=A0A1K0GPJ3_9ACTN|nr:ABC transporter permease [Couchioplanes caeruleus]OJF11163.1 ABC transporter permease [Couchioplanes caeruleus subsp. caeruleus]ROP30895.1 hypothetical protein EDD30_3771 [Couchioplanes caeruleus]
MSLATAVAPIAPRAGRPRRLIEIDSRATYVSFGLAYLGGHGAAAVSQGDTPLLDLPGWLPTALLGIGLIVGITQATIASSRVQRAASEPDVLACKLLGAGWVIGFIALFFAITALTAHLGMPELQSILWPIGSGLVVGLLYLAEGAVRRNLMHYGLGAWLALISTTALFFGTPGLFWILAIAGGGAYAAAAVLEQRRLISLAEVSASRISRR